MHLFAAANVRKLFEVVKGTKSAPDVIATAMALGRKIGKVSALAGNTDGFVANRSRAPFSTEMVIMLEEGALPEQIDKVMVDFGYPLGPFAVSDLSGLDIGYDTRKRRAEQYPNYRKLPIADRIVEAGPLGPAAPPRRRRHPAARSQGRPHPLRVCIELTVGRKSEAHSADTNQTDRMADYATLIRPTVLYIR